MEDNRENQPFEQASGLASQAAHTVMGALKAGKQACGMAAGTAAGGPLGAMVGFVVSRKMFWRVAVTLFLLAILFPVIVVNHKRVLHFVHIHCMVYFHTDWSATGKPTNATL